MNARLNAAQALSGDIGAGSVVVNDYQIQADAIDGGHRLTITRGSEVQTMDLMDGAPGAQGDTGPAGPQGEQGPQGEPGKDAPQEAVLYTPQTLTTEQQAQARENIAAAGVARLEAVDTALGGKLDSAPGTWPVWTADEQAAARERMGIPGDYDLIEEIICDGEASMYLRTVEPDGTPYDFKSIYAELEIQPSNVYSNVFFRAYEEDGTTVLYDGISAQTKSYTSHLFAGCDACSGFYHGWMINSNIGVSNIGGAASKRINMPKVIVSPIKSFRINLNSGKFYAGDKIRIYGVRA